MSYRLTVNAGNNSFVDVTDDILYKNFYTKREVKELLDNYFKSNVITEHAYIRTKTLNEIDSLIHVDTYINNNTINMSNMFYKRTGIDNKYIPFNSEFTSYKTYKDSIKDVPTTVIGKLNKMFQKNNFMISAVYRNNDVYEDIDDRHWTAEPQGVDIEWKYEWEIKRFKKYVEFEDGTSAFIWTPFTYPVLINRYAIGNDKYNIFCSDDAIYLTQNNIIYDLIINDDNTLSVQKSAINNPKA